MTPKTGKNMQTTPEQKLTDLINETCGNRHRYSYRLNNYGLAPATCGKGRVFVRVHPSQYPEVLSQSHMAGFEVRHSSNAMTLKKRSVQFLELTPRQVA